MMEMLSLLGPTWLTTLVLNTALLMLVVWVVKGAIPSFNLGKGAVAILALLLTIHSAAMGYLSIRQAEGLTKLRAASALAGLRSQEMAKPPAQPPSDRTPAQLKADFLSTVETVSLQPSMITPESKKALFEQFAVLFPRGDEDRRDYARNLVRAFECQRLVFEDALASLKSKKPVRSGATEECEKASGEFFGREKLIPLEVAKANAEMMQKLARSKSGDKDLPNEEALRLGIDQQVLRIESIRRLFEP